jgi:hypothetical protein
MSHHFRRVEMSLLVTFHKHCFKSVAAAGRCSVSWLKLARRNSGGAALGDAKIRFL